MRILLYLSFLLFSSCSNVNKINKLISESRCGDSVFYIDRPNELKKMFSHYRRLLIAKSLDSVLNDTSKFFYLAETYNFQVGTLYFRIWNNHYDLKLLIDLANKETYFKNLEEVLEYGIPEVIAVKLNSNKMRRIESMINPDNVPKVDSLIVSDVYRFKIYKIKSLERGYSIECNYLKINPFSYYKD